MMEIMVPIDRLVTIPADTPLDAACLREVLSRFSGVPVVAGHSLACLGVISAKDLQRARPDAKCVADVMTSPPITINCAAHATYAAGLLLKHGVHRVRPRPSLLGHALHHR